MDTSGAPKRFKTFRLEQHAATQRENIYLLLMILSYIWENTGCKNGEYPDQQGAWEGEFKTDFLQTHQRNY